MTTKTYLVEMPADWKPRNCPKCNWYYICGATGYDAPIRIECPFDNAKEAVLFNLEEIKFYPVNGMEANLANPKVDGEPVKLYAVEVEK